MPENYTLPMNDKRERRFDKLETLFDHLADSDSDSVPRSKLVDVCFETTLSLHANFEEHGSELPPDVAQMLSTRHVGVHTSASVYPEPVENW